MKKIILLMCLLVLVVSLSGCTQSFDVVELIKTNELVQNFLEEYPNSEITANKIKVDNSFQLANLKEACKNENIEYGNYWEVKIVDTGANSKIYSLVDSETNEAICIVINVDENKQDSDQSHQKVRKNCRELEGDLCNSEKECAKELVDSTDSYCCLIECNTCPKDIDCDNGDKCTEDKCVVEDGEAVCKHKQITPCANNGVCEIEEFSGVVSEYCPGETHAVTTVQIESEDCPSSCDDGNPDTGDWYDFDAQECKHKNCE